MRGSFLPFLILFSIGCATQPPAVPPNPEPALLIPAPAPPKPPAYLADPDHNSPPVCPAQSHLSAVGQSSQGREAALALAKRNLLVKLDATIHIEAETFSRQVLVNNQESSEFRQVERVLEKVDFAHADLMTVADAPAVYGNETYVVVCMPRQAASARLEADLAPELERFDAWYRPAQDALDRGDRPAFVTAMANLSASMAAAGPTLVQIRALAKGPSAAEQHLTSHWLPLVAASARMRAQIRFVLSSQTDAHLQPAAAEVTEAFRSALAPLGSEVRLASVCPSAAAATYLIQVNTGALCERTSLGTTCRPSFDLRGQECSSGRQVFHSGLARLSTGATDPNGEERAMRRLVKKLDPLVIREELRAALKSELPGEEGK